MRLFVKLVFLSLFVFSYAHSAQEKLVAIGGGPRPLAAIEQFVKWAGGKNARVLVISWASGEPVAAYESVRKDFEPYSLASLEMAETEPVKNRKTIRDQITVASGVFFTGGDQNRIMDILDQATDVHGLLTNKYRAGVPFAGTSAGTAVLPEVMMTGQGDLSVIDGKSVGTRKGLGFLPGVLLDQHFIVRQRSNRLFGLVLENPSKVGVGIDEGMALVIEGNRKAIVFGPTQVMRVRAKGKSLTVDLFQNGESFELK